MAFNITVVNACKFLSVRAKSFTGAGSAQVDFKDLNTGTVYSQTLTYSGNPLSGQMNVNVSNLPAANGVYEVGLYENSVEVARRPLIIHCDIDCCLAKLTNELIDCACDCPKCSSALAKAQKVFLLLQSAISTVGLASTTTGSFNSGYYQDILEKYKKARSICDNSCGCEC
tara:strand:+ start:3718 stop:4230 length:513 start_codon:yes stop_codon:yes gene_type:complete